CSPRTFPCFAPPTCRRAFSTTPPRACSTARARGTTFSAPCGTRPRATCPAATATALAISTATTGRRKRKTRRVLSWGTSRCKGFTLPAVKQRRLLV
ncbi:hypothetical protein T484DRAFT_1895732, partial [Baffinella frigidus]